MQEFIVENKLNFDQNGMQALRQDTGQSQATIQARFSQPYFDDKTHNNSSFNQSSDDEDHFQTSFAQNMLKKIGLFGSIRKSMQKQNLKDSTNSNNFKRKQSGLYKDKNLNTIINSSNSLTFIPQSEYKLLQPLKCKVQTQKIYQSLKKRSFDFNLNFYQDSLALIQKLGYKQNPDYGYVLQQKTICEKIRYLSQLYSSPVQQEKEQQLRGKLQQSKKLFSKLDPQKTVKVIRKYLKMNDQTLAYLIGRLCLQVSVPKYLIEKHIQNKKFNQIMTLICLIVHMNQLFKIWEAVQKIHDYIEFLKDQKVQIIKLKQQQRQKIVKYALISKRILQISLFVMTSDQQLKKVTTLYKTLTQVMRTLKMSQIQANGEQNQKEIIASYYLTFLTEFACKNSEVTSNLKYILKEKIQQFMDYHPICCVCLKAMNEDNQFGYDSFQKMENGKFLHFQCGQFCKDVLDVEGHTLP